MLPGQAGWYFIGAPVQSPANLSEWSELNVRVSPKQNANLFEYAEGDSTSGTYFDILTEVNGWKVPSSNANVINTSNHPKGYRLFMRESNPTRLASVTGLPYTQNVQVPLSFSPATGYEGGGWNLISNPYPCAIDWNQTRFDAANTGSNIGNAYYCWNGPSSNYGAYTSLNANTGLGVGIGGANIASSQSFFVKATGATNLTFKESFKNTGANSGSFLRTTTEALEFLKFRVSQNNLWDESAVLFYPGSTNGVDNFDALNLSGSAVDVAAVMDNGTNAAINVLPEIGDQRIIPLKVQTPTNGTASFSFEGINQFPLGVQIYLKDDEMGILQNLRTNPAYAFQGNSAQAFNRFSLIFIGDAVTAGANVIPQSKWSLYPNPAMLEVFVQSPNAANARLMNALGQQVMQIALQAGQNRIDLRSLPRGMYWLNSEGQSPQKLVVE